MRVLFSMLIVCIWLSAAAQSGQTEMSKAIGQMQQLYGVNFVYDASLTAVRPKQKPQPDKTLAENLRRVFGGTVSNGKYRTSMFCCCVPICIPFPATSAWKTESR